jgi:hypothetical protein
LINLPGTDLAGFSSKDQRSKHVRIIFSFRRSSSNFSKLKTMTEITIDKQPTRRFDVSRLFAVLRHPTSAFTAMLGEARATWLTPMLLLSLTTIVVVIVSGYFRSRSAMTGEVSLPPDWQYWSPEMQNDYMQAQQADQGTAFVYILPLVGGLTAVWLGWALLAGLLHLGSTLLGGRGSMQNALNVVAWASLPFAIRDILRIIFMMSAGHAIVSPGLSGFIANPGFLSQVLARVDLFWIWHVILLVIGLAIADGLPRNKAFVGVAVVLLLVLSVQAGVGNLISGIGGGQNAARPF